MPRPPEYEEGGLNARAMVASGHGAYRQAALGCGRDEAELADCDEDVQAAWANAVANLLPVMEESEGASFTMLAEQLYMHFWGSLAVPPRPFADQAPEHRLPWLAAVRHLANCLTGFDDEQQTDPAAHEEYWRGWAADALASSRTKEV